MYLKFRPYLFEFLELMSEKFELVVFCSGSEMYCASVLDDIEHCRKYFSYRIYNDHVLFENSQYSIKDYDILFSNGRTTDNTIIVEHKILAFCMKVFNGVLVKYFSATSSKQDNELIYLAKYLEELNAQPSVCKYIGDTIRLSMFKN